jgi:hypothetical protein
VDSETSSLRWLRGGVVHTAVGQGLFDFGHTDGPAEDALLQHPLGVTVLPDRSVAVLDTYNSAVRRFDPELGAVSTLAVDLAEPSGAVVVGEHLLVVESAAHRLTRIPLPDKSLVVPGTSYRTRREPLLVAAGTFEVHVVFEPPPGQKLDERYGPSTRLLVSATPPELVVDGAGSSAELDRTVVLSADVVSGVLHVAAFAASCDDATEVEFPACHVHQQDWGIPVVVEPGGETRLTLMLGGRT